MDSKVTIAAWLHHNPDIRYGGTGIPTATVLARDPKDTWYEFTAQGVLAENLVLSMSQGDNVLATGVLTGVTVPSSRVVIKVELEAIGPDLNYCTAETRKNHPSR